MKKLIKDLTSPPQSGGLYKNLFADSQSSGIPNTLYYQSIYSWLLNSGGFRDAGLSPNPVENPWITFDSPQT